VSPASPWFWIVVGVGTAALVAAGRWVWNALTRAAREWIREPVTEAKDRAEVAASHAETLLEAVGEKNGHGDLMTIAAELLTNQQQVMRTMDEFAGWRVDHDAMDAETRQIADATAADVSAIKTHLGMEAS